MYRKLDGTKFWERIWISYKLTDFFEIRYVASYLPVAT